MTDKPTKFKELKKDKLRVECHEHKTLNKYYSKSQKIFICEYCTMNNVDGKDLVHLTEILERNRDKIIRLQKTKQNLPKGTTIHQTLLSANKEYNSIELESTLLNTFVVNFDLQFFTRIQNLIFYSDAFEEIQEMINNIVFYEDGKPDLKKNWKGPTNRIQPSYLCAIIGSF